jgi:hypothetical protein
MPSLTLDVLLQMVAMLSFRIWQPRVLLVLFGDVQQ